MRWRTRRAVSALACQMGLRISSTSPLVTSETGRSPIRRKAYSFRLLHQSCACFSLRQPAPSPPNSAFASFGIAGGLQALRRGAPSDERRSHGYLSGADDTLAWVAVGLVLLPILAILGLVMRTLQAGYFAATPPEWFCAVMTLHGLGMVGVWFVAGLAAMSFLLTSYVRPKLTVSWIALGMTAVGVVLLVAATLAGKLGVGWPSSIRCPSFPGRGSDGQPRRSSPRSACSVWRGRFGRPTSCARSR